jgi:Zn-dependent protease with chaperone function
MSENLEAFSERQMRVRYYMLLKRMNTDFFIGEIAITLIGQLLFNSVNTAYLWLVPLLLVLLAYFAHSYLISYTVRKYRNLRQSTTESARSIRSILIFPLLVMLSLHVPALIEASPGYIGLLVGIIIATSGSIIFHMIPSISEIRITRKPYYYKNLGEKKLLDLRMRLPEPVKDATIIVPKNNGRYFANAFNIGNRRSIIMITWYMESNMSVDQLSALILHEFGHYVNGDSRILRRKYTSFALIYFNLLVILSFFLPDILILFYLVAYVGFYFVSLTAARTQRKMEYSADLFAARSGFANELRSALTRVDDLNFIPSDIPESAGSSHPSTLHRINWLEQNNY